MSITSEYERLGHAIQSGVSYDQNPHTKDPKHLAVGNCMRASDHAALAALLMEKGIFTREEYEAALIDALKAEKARWEAYLAEQYGSPVKLA
jgi:hypothetical protein